VHLLGRQPIAVGALGHAYSRASRQTEALRTLDELLELHSQMQVDAYSIALIYASLGRENETIEWLDKGCNSHTGLFAYVAHGDPRLDSVRSNPHFQDLLQRMRLV
jgi:tetratricopeptide (TPR) repeat protein